MVYLDLLRQAVRRQERHTATRTDKAVDMRTAEELLYLSFSGPTDAQNAYALFLYHKERGT